MKKEKKKTKVGKKKIKVYKTMEEFDKEFFPKSFEKEKRVKNTDAHSLGVRLAKESLDKVKTIITK